MKYTKKIHNDILQKIKQMENGSYVYKKDLIKILHPQYNQQEIIEALDYLSHSQVEIIKNELIEVPSTIERLPIDLSLNDGNPKDEIISIIKLNSR